MDVAYQQLAKKIAEPSKEGKTALHYALKFRASAEFVLDLLRLSSKEGLLQRGTIDGYTPLHEACSARASKKIIQMVLRACPEALQILDEVR